MTVHADLEPPKRLMFWLGSGLALGFESGRVGADVQYINYYKSIARLYLQGGASIRGTCAPSSVLSRFPPVSLALSVDAPPLGHPGRSATKADPTRHRHPTPHADLHLLEVAPGIRVSRTWLFSG